MDKGHATKSATSGTAIGNSSSTQHTTGETTTNSTTKSQALKPRSEVRSVLQSVEFASVEEQAIEAIKLVETLSTGACVVQVAGIGTATATTPEAIEQLADLSTIVDRYVEEFFANQLAQPWFSDANEQLLEREAFQQSISSHLQLLIEERQLRVNPRLADTETIRTIELHAPHDSVPQVNQMDGTDAASAKRKSTDSLDPDWYDDEDF
jgi:hypothetical protein